MSMPLPQTFHHHQPFSLSLVTCKFWPCAWRIMHGILKYAVYILTLCIAYRIPDLYQLLMMIILFVYVVFYHSRLVEVTSRLDFLWKKQAEHELQDMKETRTYNSQLLRNILPDHVAMHFLAAEERRHEVSRNFTFPFYHSIRLSKMVVIF